MSTLILIDTPLIDQLTVAAAQTARQRLNHNFHGDYSEPSQRLLNAVLPESYVRPHRHSQPPKAESFLLLRGELAVLTFTDRGELAEAVRLQSSGPLYGVDVPAGLWHAVIALATGTVYFEAKSGPYEPLADKDWAPWAPPEGSPAAALYLEQLRAEVLQRLSTRGEHA